MFYLNIYFDCMALLVVWLYVGESTREVMYRANALDEVGNFSEFCKCSIFEDVRLIFVQNQERDGYVTLPDWTECGQLEQLSIVVEAAVSTSIFPIDSFLGLRQLKSLNLKGNRLETLPENIFQDLSMLESLDLGRNELTEISDLHLSGLTKLTYLGLARNRITELTVNATTNLKNLRKLDLSNNFFEIIPEETFQGLSSLTRLDISKNRLFTLFVKQFSGNRRLTELNVSLNKIKYIRNETFISNRSLKRIDFFKNRLKSVSALNFKGLEEIEEVNLGFNYLKEFSIKNELPNSLKRLSLNGNPLECHSSNLRLSKRLKTVVVGQCKDVTGRRHILSEI